MTTIPLAEEFSIPGVGGSIEPHDRRPGLRFKEEVGVAPHQYLPSTPQPCPSDSKGSCTGLATTASCCPPTFPPVTNSFYTPHYPAPPVSSKCRPTGTKAFFFATAGGVGGGGNWTRPPTSQNPAAHPLAYPTGGGWTHPPNPSLLKVPMVG